MDGFLALYTKITKDDILRNRNNAAEWLGFLGRVIHGTDQEHGSGKSGSSWESESTSAAAIGE